MRKKPIHYASDFDLDVNSGDDDLFRWFLLTYLLGKPIQSTVAVRTWKLFIERKIDIPWTILDMPERKLVRLLHEGGYTRYQHVTTSALKKCMKQLVDQYDGSLTMMIDISQNEDELNQQLQTLFGVGPKTAEIFMRETQEYFARRVE